jgi:SPOR domain
VRNAAGDLAKEFDALIDGSPEIARWLVDPTRELKKRLEERVKPVLATASAKIAGFIAAPRTAEFLELLSNPGNAARDRLIEVYREDKSGKGLIAFTDVAAIVDKDLNIHGQYLAPETFAALAHSVTQAKLSLLAPDELNRLVKDFAGTRPSTSKPSGDVFPAHDGNFSLLLNAVRSLDGNQQWQAYGLPYPRKVGVALASPARFPYGEDGYKDRSKGFPIWTDGYLREKVFVALFPGGVLGALDERPELKWRNDRFPACAQHPYPQTQDPRTGRILSEDTTCAALPVPVVSAAPAMPERQPAAEPPAAVATAPTATAQEFADRYFQCGKQISGQPHWTVAGSYRIEDNARRKAAAIRQAYPDMTAEAWSPRGDSEFWTVMVAACTTSDRAQEARDLVVRRGIARDAFIWGPALAEDGGRTTSMGR